MIETIFNLWIVSTFIIVAFLSSYIAVDELKTRSKVKRIYPNADRKAEIYSQHSKFGNVVMILFCWFPLVNLIIILINDAIMKERMRKVRR